MKLPALKSCPFCGSYNLELSNTHTPSFSVTCQDCGGEASGEYFPGPHHKTRFHYSQNPQGKFEADFAGLWPEYQKAAVSACNAWNRRKP